ncbi:MAG TPA: peptidyl-prolyl cis-trans isomerase [Pirellulales bacterium]|nr:peptidyl-prolyl cis-trans isomerase [Pirellulales bacterium]
MSRLFYPILLTVTTALAATLWTRHGLPTLWVSAVGTAVAQAQSPPDNRPGNPAGPVATTPRPQRLPPTGRPNSAPATNSGRRLRPTPLTQLQIDTPGGPGALQISKPVPIPGAQVMARVGNEIIMAGDLLPKVQEQFEQFKKSVPPERHEEVVQVLMHNNVLEAVKGKMIVAEMKENEIPKDKWGEVEKDILKKFDVYRLPDLLKHEKVKTVAELDQKLKQKGSSLKHEKEAFIDMALISEWLRKEIKYDEHVGHDEMSAYYHEHRPEYEFKAKVRYEEIRVNYGTERDKRAAWDAIHQLAKQVHAGAPLADVAKAHSDASSAPKGGLNDWTTQGSIRCQPLDRTLFQLPIGVLSQVIDDGRAYIVVRVLERTEAGITSFQDAQLGIQKKIKEQREKAAREKKIMDFMIKQKARVWTIYDDAPLQAAKPRKTSAR